jgi:hypothetical protein
MPRRLGGAGPRGEENVMDARTGAEAITTRLGAVAFPLGVILLVVSTIIHPGGQVMNNPVIFRVYAQDAAGSPPTSASGSVVCCSSAVCSLFTTPLRQSQRRRLQE